MTRTLLCLLSLALSGFFSSAVFAQTFPDTQSNPIPGNTSSVTVSYRLPTEREDGSPLPLNEIKKATVLHFCDKGDGNWIDGGKQEQRDASLTQITFTPVSHGLCTFSMYVTDVNSLSSETSEPLQIQVPGNDELHPPKGGTVTSVTVVTTGN